MKSYILLLIFIIGTISLIFAKDETIGGKKVASIGACDMQGLCGVLFTDGTTYRVRYPVVGQVIK